MGFKAQMAADLDTFINVEEFAETHSVDGAPSVASILDDEQGVWTAEGVYITTTTLHVKTGTITTPVVDQRVTIDGKPATVLAVNESAGVLALTLRWFES